jgi:hypothetical protein
MENKKTTVCREIRYREFPEMLFGEVERGAAYFNADRYIREKGDAAIHSVEKFRAEFGFWIRAVSEAYGLNAEELFIRDKATGDMLAEESLSLLFIAYIDSGFAVYMLERMSEMLLNGMVLSDTALVSMAKERLSKEDLT